MSVEVGQKLKGKVTGIKNFGAFVALENKESGLVHLSLIHISEPTRREWLSRMPSSA